MVQLILNWGPLLKNQLFSARGKLKRPTASETFWIRRLDSALPNPPLSVSPSLIFGKMGNSSKDDSATDGDTSSGDTPPSNSGVYSEGEKVLAYHGPRIYEAKAHTPFLSLS